MKKYFEKLSKSESKKFSALLGTAVIANTTGLISLINYVFWNGEDLYLFWFVILGMLSALTYGSIVERYGILKRIADKDKGNNIYLSTRSEIDDISPLHELFKNVSEVRVMALNSSALLGGAAREYTKEALIAGTDFKLIVVECPSQACDELRDNKIYKKKHINPMQESIDKLIEIKRETSGYDGQIEWRTTEVNLPFSLMIIYRKDANGNQFIDYMKVDIISIGTKNRERPSFVVPMDNVKLKEFFEKQWNKVWSNQIWDDTDFYTVKKEESLCRELVSSATRK